MNEALPYFVACPTCGAAVGDACVVASEYEPAVLDPKTMQIVPGRRREIAIYVARKSPHLKRIERAA